MIMTELSQLIVYQFPLISITETPPYNEIFQNLGPHIKENKRPQRALIHSPECHCLQTSSVTSTT